MQGSRRGQKSESRRNASPPQKGHPQGSVPPRTRRPAARRPRPQGDAQEGAPRTPPAGAPPPPPLPYSVMRLASSVQAAVELAEKTR